MVINNFLSKQEIVSYLQSSGAQLKALYARSAQLRDKYVGSAVYLRGLIEFSNICEKDCLYCGIRKSNATYERYELTVEQIVASAMEAERLGYGSVVLQSGEWQSGEFVEKLGQVLKAIKTKSEGKIGITLSCGEQPKEVYRYWFECGAHRYLLRIETSNKQLYESIHPRNEKHQFEKRLECLETLKGLKYQLGSGIMIGLPGQTVEMLADDLLFLQKLDVDMCGMGPYIEHADAPLSNSKKSMFSLDERYRLSLNCVAALRILMPDINIAATTALQAIKPLGREVAIEIGANVMMPNVTPVECRGDYLLYSNKPCVDESPECCASCIDHRLPLSGYKPQYRKWGDSLRYQNRSV